MKVGVVISLYPRFGKRSLSKFFMCLSTPIKLFATMAPDVDAAGTPMPVEVIEYNKKRRVKREFSAATSAYTLLESVQVWQRFCCCELLSDRAAVHLEKCSRRTATGRQGASCGPVNSCRSPRRREGHNCRGSGARSAGASRASPPARCQAPREPWRWECIPTPQPTRSPRLRPRVQQRASVRACDKRKNKLSRG